MSINRELSQLASFIDVQEDNNFIGISTAGTYTVGIGTSSVLIGTTGIITATQFIGPTGSSLIDHIDLQDEGNLVGTGFTTLNFVGAAITITQGVTGVATITVDSAVVGGEDGAVQFASGGSLTGISTLLFADSTNHRVGIGSSSPTAKLDVDGTVNVTGLSTFHAHIRVKDYQYIYFGNDNDLKIGHNPVTGESYIIEDGVSDLIINATNLKLQSAGGKNYFVGTYNSSVELYYNDSKKFETVGTGVSISSGTASTATIYGPGNLIIDPAPVDDNGGIVRIKGDLYVDGTTTEINSTTLTIDDLNVVVASGATNGLTADGAGLSVAGAGATIKYNYNGGNEQWVFNKAPYYNTHRLLTTADEGSGNGIDADTLDGQEGSHYLDYSNFVGVATDADKLDGLHAGSFIRSDANDTFTGLLEQQAGAYSDNVTYGGRSFTAGVRLKSTSMRGGILVSNENDFRSLDDHASFMVYDAYNTSSETYAFRASVGSTLADKYWVTTQGNAYFSGDVGIGTNNPDTKLDVAGDISIRNGDQLNVIRTNSAGQLQFLRNAANNNQVTVTIDDETGNVGIGTDNPDSKLHLNTASGGTDLLLETTAGLDNSITFNEGGGNFFRILHQGSAGSNPNNLFKIQTATSSGGINNDAITIEQSGDVGIGTDAPSYGLELSGSRAWFKPNQTGASDVALSLGRLADNNQPFYDIVTNDASGDLVTHRINRYTGTWRFNRSSPSGEQNGIVLSSYYNTGSQVGIYNTTGSDYRILLRGENDCYFLNEGNIGIGTDSPLAKLEVRDGSVYLPGGTFDASSLGGGNDSVTNAALVMDRGNTIYVQASGYLRKVVESDGTELNIGQQGTAHITEINVRPGTTGGQVKLHAGSNSDNVKLTTTGYGVTITGGINVSGVATATDFNSASDENLKTNIRTIEDPLAKVVQIRGVNFDWKETQRPALGVIAQEVEKVLPELVTDNGTKTVNYNGLIGLLIETVKEQQKQIDTLSERLSKLE